MLIIIIGTSVLIIVSLIRWVYCLEKRIIEIEQHLREIYKNIR